MITPQPPAALVYELRSFALGELFIATRERKGSVRSAMVEADGTETVVGWFGWCDVETVAAVGAGPFGGAYLGFHRRLDECRSVGGLHLL